MCLQMETLHINGSSKITATKRVWEGECDPECSLGELGKCVLQKSSCCIPFFPTTVSVNKLFEDCIAQVQQSGSGFPEAWDCQVCLVSLLRKLICVDFQGRWK